MGKSRTVAKLPATTPEQRRIATDNFDRARQVIGGGNFEYGIQLLLTCCKLDPGNLQYRQALRKAQKDKYGNNGKGSWLAFLATPRNKARAKAAKASGDYRRCLEYGELVLSKNPWDIGIQMDMADAFDALGLVDLAVFSLEQARQKNPKDATLNRAMARMFEKRGDFKKAMAMWQLVKDSNPGDVEAAHKAKDLAASETIARGGYEQVISGSKESPVLAQMESKVAENASRISRESDSLIKRIEADPTEPTLYLQLAAAHRKANDIERARAALQQGLGPTGNHPSLQLELNELEILPFRRQLEAIETKLKAVQQSKLNDDTAEEELPDEQELLRSQQKLLKEIHTREIEITRARADRFPNDLSHRLELGTKLLRMELIDQAIAELQQARRDDKYKGKACMNLGLCFRKRNNWRLAQRNFEEALQALNPSDLASRKETLYQLATGTAESGDIAKALDFGHELANLDFNYKGIGPMLDVWQSNASGKT